MRARNIKQDASLNLSSIFSELHLSNPIPHIHRADTSQSPGSQQSIPNTAPPSEKCKEVAASPCTGVVLLRKDDSPSGCPVPGDGRKITHHIIEEAEQDHVQEPVDGSAHSLCSTHKSSLLTQLVLSLLLCKPHFLEKLF